MLIEDASPSPGFRLRTCSSCAPRCARASRSSTRPARETALRLPGSSVLALCRTPRRPIVTQQLACRRESRDRPR